METEEMTPYCPHCHKPLIVTRAGVQLPPLKARIFDVVAQAGANGVTTRELIADVYQNRAPLLATVRHHIAGINTLLQGTGLRIKRKDHRHWRMQRVGGGASAKTIPAE